MIRRIPHGGGKQHVQTIGGSCEQTGESSVFARPIQAVRSLSLQAADQQAHLLVRGGDVRPKGEVG